MKFDKILNDIASAFLVEMPIAMYPTDSTKDWDPKAPWPDHIEDPSGILSSIKTGPEKKGQKQLIVSKFIKAASEFFFQTEMREKGGRPQDIIINAKNAVYGDESNPDVYREMFEEIGEDIIDYLLPNGYNPAEDAGHMKDIANTQILVNIIKRYLESKNVENAFGINKSYAGFTTVKLIQILFGEFGQGKHAGSVNVNVDDTPARHLAKRNFTYKAKRGKAGTQDITPIDIHDTDTESKAFESKQVLQEMPFRPHPSVLKRYYGGDVSRGKEMFIERVVENLLNSKHARINDEYNKRGSSLYHAGNTASIAFNKNINDITAENMKPILEAYLGAIYDVIFKDNKNPAKNVGWLKEEVKKAIIQSIDIISEKIKQINGTVPNNVEETFEAISDNSADLDYFARVVVNTAIESMAVLQESEDDAEESEEEQKKKQEEDSEQIQQENNTSSNDDDEEEYDDDDDDTESSNFAYDQGLLDDEEEIEDENKIDDEADTTVQRLDRAGTDIASVFLRSLDAIEDEMNDEDEDWEDEEGDVEARDSEEDEWRREFRGRGLSRSDLEDEDNYDPSSDVFGRDYDQD